jgi:pyridoxal 5'-phosphate synthase pdxS subunit
LIHNQSLADAFTHQARIAEEAGAAAVMALERVPADIRAQGGVARMSDPAMIKEIMNAVTIPVMAKARIGHFVECQVCFLRIRR